MDDQRRSEQDAAAHIGAAESKVIGEEAKRESAASSDSSFSWARATKLFTFTSTLFAVCLVLMLLATSASAPLQTTHRQATVSPLLPPKEFRGQQGWRRRYRRHTTAQEGLLHRKVSILGMASDPCVHRPKYPMPPRSGVVPEIVGNGNDIAAQAPTWHHLLGHRLV